MGPIGPIGPISPISPMARRKIINKQNATGPWNEIIGLILIGIGIVILLALISYDSADPSWNSVSEKTRARNWVGPMGANVSNALYQTFGIAALIEIGRASCRERG